MTRGLRPVRAALAAALCAAAQPALAAECGGPGPDEVTCLACNIYYEARDQSEAGQWAVAMVTLNRLRSPRHPKTICGVVWEKGRDYRTGALVAQFSWTLERRGPPAEPAAWRKAMQLAHDAVRSADAPERLRPDPSLGALFFHAWYVSPDWATDGSMDLVTRIGDHLFYRNRGSTAGGVRPRVLPVVHRAAPTAAPAQTAAALPAGTPWVKPGAKLIRVSAGPEPNTVRISSYHDGRVQTMLAGRERPR